MKPRSVTSALMGDPPAGRTPWADPSGPSDGLSPVARHAGQGSPMWIPPVEGAHIKAGGYDLDPSIPAGETGGAKSYPPTLRPVTAMVLAVTPGEPPTTAPLIEWMEPTALLIDGAYQRGLSERSKALIARIVQGWDWRRFKPPIVAWTEAGFEIIDGQHTAIAAATHPAIEKIPVLVVEAAQMTDRASAFVGHNRDRLTVTAMQMHHAMVAAGNDEAVTVEQVCAKAGVTLVRSAFGGYRWRPGDSVAVGAINGLIGRRGAKGARELLQALVAAGLAPVGANDIKAAELLFTDPDFAGELEPLPEGGADLAAAIRTLGAGAQREAKDMAAMKCLPLWKATAAVWFKKTRKRRKTS